MYILGVYLLYQNLELDYKKVYKELARQKLKEDIRVIPEMHLGLSNDVDDVSYYMEFVLIAYMSIIVLYMNYSV